MIQLDRKLVASSCRVLGVHITVNLEELKQARDRMAKLYHPDKNAGLSSEALKKITEKFQQIQASYDYLKDNFEQIQVEYKHIKTNALSSRGPHRAHWIYSEISNY